MVLMRFGNLQVVDKLCNSEQNLTVQFLFPPQYFQDGMPQSLVSLANTSWDGLGSMWGSSAPSRRSNCGYRNFFRSWGEIEDAVSRLLAMKGGKGEPGGFLRIVEVSVKITAGKGGRKEIFMGLSDVRNFPPRRFPITMGLELFGQQSCVANFNSSGSGHDIFRQLLGKSDTRIETSQVVVNGGVYVHMSTWEDVVVIQDRLAHTKYIGWRKVDANPE